MLYWIRASFYLTYISIYFISKHINLRLLLELRVQILNFVTRKGCRIS